MSQELIDAVINGTLGWQNLVRAAWGKLCPDQRRLLNILKPASAPEEE